MDDLFRFITIRPPQTPDTHAIASASTSDYQQALAEFRTGESAVVENYVRLTTAFMGSPEFAGPLRYAAAYAALRASLQTIPASVDRALLASRVTTAFGKSPDALLVDADFQSDGRTLSDNIVAAVIAPRVALSYGVTALSLAESMGSAAVVALAANTSTTVVNPASVTDALTPTIVLPPAVFPVNPEQIQPVGVADLLVVKQHLARYELGEIASIENLLKGESRKLAKKHTITTEQTTTTDSSTSTETTNELTTDERFSLQRETQNTVTEDTSVKGSLSVSAKYGDSLQVNANADASYTNSKTESTKTAANYAKDVTMRAATKVTQTFRQTVVSRVLETLEEDAQRSLDNHAGTGNITGVYQFIDKIYLAQVFNYGKRLLFDVMIPEPGAFLRDAALSSQQMSAPVPPKPFTLVPSELSAVPTDANYFGNFLTMYGVDNMDAPPLDNVTAAKTFTLSNDDKTMDKAAELPIPDGFRAISATVGAMYNFSNAASNGMNVFVGNLAFTYEKQAALGDQTRALAHHEAKIIPIAIEVYGVSDYAVAVEIMCEPMDGAWATWRLKTHGRIVDAWTKKQQDYEDAVAKLQFQNGGSSPLGGNNPEANRKIEQRELKRSAIQILYDPDLNFTAVTESPAPPPKTPPGPPVPYAFPRPDRAKSVELGKIVRFFEQAFEWENMMYVCYPYFWGRQKTWYVNAMDQNVDPLFQDFLNAGAARLVLPVRPTFEGVLRYYLLTGQIWGGGDLPNVTDATYLPITEEIKELTGAPGTETPQGPPWEVRVPTSFVKLRKDALLPGWKHTGGLAPAVTQDWDWKADPPDA